jgi:hypothetical protein
MTTPRFFSDGLQPWVGIRVGIVLGSNPAARQSSTTVAEKPGKSEPPAAISCLVAEVVEGNARPRCERVRGVDVDDRGFVPETLALECVVGRGAERDDEVEPPCPEVAQQDAGRVLAGVERDAGGLGRARGEQPWGEFKSGRRRHPDAQRADRRSFDLAHRREHLLGVSQQLQASR